MAVNPYVNKVEYGGNTIIDLTDATATADKILSGYTAYGATGEKLTGTASGGGVTTTALSVTTNGTYTAPAGTAYTPVTVNVSGGGSIIPSSLPAGKAVIVGYNIPADAPEVCKTITLFFTHDSSATISEVDWGDNTTPTTTTGSGRKTLTHTYIDTGGHIAAVAVSGGTITIGGNSSRGIGGKLSYVQNLIKWAVVNTGVSLLDTYSFGYCTNMEEIRLSGSSFTKINASAFESCINLKELIIPNTVTEIGNYIARYCASLLKVSLPTNANFTSIPNSAFNDCYLLTDITIPSSVTTLNSNSFINCVGLKDIVIPNNVTAIPSGCFNTCRNLKNVVVPSNITSIGGLAFAYNTGLCKLRFNRTTPPTVDASTAFSTLPTTCVISVPMGCLSAYTSAANYPSSSTYTYIEE